MSRFWSLQERLDVLLKRMEESGLDLAGYDAYIDLRRYGTQKHAGFGVGFERLVTYATGMPYPPVQTLLLMVAFYPTACATPHVRY